MHNLLWIQKTKRTHIDTCIPTSQDRNVFSGLQNIWEWFVIFAVAIPCVCSNIVTKQPTVNSPTCTATVDVHCRKSGVNKTCKCEAKTRDSVLMIEDQQETLPYVNVLKWMNMCWQLNQSKTFSRPDFCSLSHTHSPRTQLTGCKLTRAQNTHCYHYINRWRILQSF